MSIINGIFRAKAPTLEIGGRKRAERLLGSGGGGGVVVPTITDNATFVADDMELSITLTNESTTSPSAIDLEFTNNALEGVDPDNGTASSPSYILEAKPNPGYSRVIKLTRGSGAPKYGAANLTETISATLADGAVATVSVTVQPSSRVAGAVRTVSKPTVEFDGSSLNTGSAGSEYNWKVDGNASITNTPDRTGFGGYADITGSSDSLYYELFEGTDTVAGRYSGQARSWIWVFESKEVGGYTGSSKYLTTYGIKDTSSDGIGLFYSKSSGQERFYYTGTSDWDMNSTSYDHSINGAGASEGLVFQGTENELVIIAVSWDGADVRVRWKTETHGAGFSYRDYTTPSHGTPPSNPTLAVNGKKTSGNGSDVRYHYFGILDSEISDSEFDYILEVMGM